MEEVGLLEPNTVYHLYTRGINGETIFRSKENYFHFLELFKKYAAPYLDVYAYCLLPNHLHFLVRTKDEEALQWQSAAGESGKMVQIHRQLGHLLNAYTKAFNKCYNRKDSLFQKRFRRR